MWFRNVCSAGTRQAMHRDMPLRAILFDKDGTLVDFHATWGAATYAAMERMTAGDADKLARLAAAND
jgi:phosphoglycolate phosphatase-like HAD superfamily hydrolase